MKKRPDEKASEHAETKYQREEPTHGWRQLFRGAFAELSGHSWLQNFLIGLALLLVWPLIGVTVMKTYRATIIGFGVGVTILVWIAVVVLLHQAKDADTEHPPEPEHLPNIVFGNSTLREPLVAGRTPWVDIVIQNTSDVGAEGRFSDVTWRIVVPPDEGSLEYAYQGKAIDFDLAARQFRTIHFDITYQFSQGDIDALNSREFSLYVYAKGEYWADGKPSTKRPLPFCFVYDKDTPGFLAVCPKGLRILEGKPGNITYPNPTPIAKPTAKRGSRAAGLSLNTESHASPSIDIKVARKGELPKQKKEREKPRPNTSPPMYPSGILHPERSLGQSPPIVDSILDKSRLAWTDYTHDSFYGVLWEWSYRPGFEYMMPRDIRGFCPECLNGMTEVGGRTFDENGTYAIFTCGRHPLNSYLVPAENDAYDGVRRLVGGILKSGEWKEIVWRQLNSPR